MNRFTASILVTLAPLCLFTGAVLEVGIRPAIAQEVPATPQEIEALRAEGDRLFAEGERLLGSCGYILPYFYSISVQCYEHLPEYEQALETFQQAFTLYEEIGDQQRIAEILNKIGQTYYRLDGVENIETAIATYTQALKLFTDLGDQFHIAQTHHYLGLGYNELGETEQALAHYEVARTLWIELDEPIALAETLLATGTTYQSIRQGVNAATQFQLAYEIFHQHQLLEQELDSLWLWGFALNAQGLRDQSLELLNRALRISQQAGNPYRTARILNIIALRHRLSGEYRQSLEAYEQGLATLQGEESYLAEKFRAGILTDTSFVYVDLGNLEQSIESIDEAISIEENLDHIRGKLATSLVSAYIYYAFDEYSRSIEIAEEVLSDARLYEENDWEATALEVLSWNYRELGEYDKAIEALNKALNIWQEFGILRFEGEVHVALGYTWLELEEYDQSIHSFQAALDVAQAVDNAYLQHKASRGLALALYANGQSEQAIYILQQALYHNQITSNSIAARANLLKNLGDIFHGENLNELAILFYKEAVNTTEIIRQDIRLVSLDLQVSYTESVADTYRTLADLLLQQDRVLEAQRVLDLLKVQELDDYLRDVRGNEQTVTGVEFLPPEEELSALYDRAIAQGIELTELREIPLSDRTPAQQARLAELVATQQDLTLSFDAFVNHPDVQDLVAQLTRTARRQNLDLEYLTAIQDNLRNLEQDAVLLYPLILDDRLELILVTPYAPPIRRTVNVTRVDLNQTIVDLRHFLNSPFSTDSRPAQQLYQWLIQPIAADLAAAQAETIVYAPDGPLRYVPLAALQDGDQWLIEQFRITHITAASLTDFNTVPQDRLQVFAGAFANGVVEVEVGDRQLQYGGLPFAGSEVAAIAATIPNTTTLLDEDFSPAATLPILDDHTIVHLATHAEFVSGRPDQSFILFGNGEHVTLRDIATWSLSHVDLVVLSACQTAVGDELGNGEEILGFGYQIQRTGAKAAIASLWPVSDAGTQALMAVFYSALAQGMAKAEALQAAQISLINEPSVAATGTQRSITVIGDRQEINTATVPTYNHPYYWAPFILIGNGL
jgi:CHAT domain-containing protein/tetratricopeptide (TPR) repeat protein